ncbi:MULTISPECIES: type IX secretion system ring protein PorN/GldN [Olivibacter]|jgi:gliding motility associated protien GldN|uniref:Gliding motility protein GldN n=1 Tax=Olivibacter oleidegradans TaxID=760123 RepID=A0ABV6HGS7_9SPHI|nr:MULTISPECIES: gliding motility protein GldN [Olivibacter]MDM8176736.1 gliding motility protein GldN [Olivibacter sp. 47]QEL00553.1 gliding motility protein GldN [Olivibacter sp. LS-1]
MKMFLTGILSFFCFFGLLAQETPDTTIVEEGISGTIPDSMAGNGSVLLIDTVPQTDGYYQVSDLHDAVPFAYPKVNPKNIRFYKRVWRDIDLKDKENYIFAIPGASLMEAIMKSIKEGKLTPYNPEDDGFKTKLTAREGEARFTDSVLVPIFDNEGNQIDAKMTLNEFNPEKVTKFRIKEDIFFDKQRGKLETRIIGVAPLMTINSSAELAESVGETPAFWLYFPQLRYTLVQLDVSDPDKELYDMTMDDLFVQRKFSSKIVRQTSPSQRMQYAADGQDTTERDIQDKIQLYKDRLWRNPKGVNSDDLVSKDEDYLREKKEKNDRKKEKAVLRNEQAEGKESRQ